MIEIGRMQAGDTKGAAAIEAEVFSEPWSQQGFLDAISMGENIFLAAKEEDKVIGYIGMYRSLDEGEITNVAVADSCRRRGVARGLIEELLRICRECGVATIFLEVRVSNEAAIALYRGFGFEKIGTRKGFYQFPKEDADVMRCSLAAE